MHRTLPFLALGLGVLAPAAVFATVSKPAAKQFAAGTPVVIVGRVSSQPRNATFVHEHKMQVSVGPNRTDYTLHLKGAKIFGPNGAEAQVSDLRDRWWVRAEGRVMDDPKRIEVSKLQVFSKTGDSLKGTAYYKSGLPHGYVTAVAGSRQTFPR
jgi:hypothetical protein